MIGADFLKLNGNKTCKSAKRMAHARGMMAKCPNLGANFLGCNCAKLLLTSLHMTAEGVLRRLYEQCKHAMRSEQAPK